MSERLFRSRFASPIGPLFIVCSAQGLLAVGLGKPGRPRFERWLGRISPGAELVEGSEETAAVERQLRQYFEGRRCVFALPLDLRGTSFQKTVWNAVAEIPFGTTASYGQIAHLIGKPKASRAVGAANGANPIPIVIPCHRVIGSDKSLTGYGGGLPMKSWLLAHEGVLRPEAVQMGLFRERPAQPHV